ncbi:MAG: O-antigen polymerase [Variovorax sp.]|nr:O-antigen polymerase [Variovorax sp.]
MQRSHIVRPAAMVWGAVVYMPVGVNYLGFALVLAALLLAGQWRERASRVRAHALWWPVAAYVAWTFIVLALGPHYPQTPSNLAHGLRIAATLLMALALTREEALWALRGFVAVTLLNLVMIALYYTVGFPVYEAWRGTLMEVGNKSISNALLFAVFGASAAVLGFAWLAARRWGPAVAAFAFPVAVAVVDATALISRTAVLGLLVAVALAALHQWRRRLHLVAPALLLGGALAAAALWQAPAIQTKMALGLQELEAAQAGAVSKGSWVIRFYMYRDTARMIADRPLAGWGIGGWTDQWHLRGPALLADSNMPHNDFLWMGAQAGVPGALSLLVIMGVGLWLAWHRRDLTGRLALVAMLVLMLATSVNSALRDAQIGLSLLWVAMLYLRLAGEPDEPWRELAPRLRAIRRSRAA